MAVTGTPALSMRGGVIWEVVLLLSIAAVVVVGEIECY